MPHNTSVALSPSPVTDQSGSADFSWLMVHHSVIVNLV
jgi:hypothetical protein